MDTIIITPYTQEEMDYCDKAVEFAKTLGRPFTGREVFFLAREDGYELSPQLDYKNRFIKHCGRVGKTPPLWVLAENA